MKYTYSFNGFIGQRKVVDYAVTLLHGAKANGEACPDILLQGGSGLGRPSSLTNEPK